MNSSRNSFTFQGIIVQALKTAYQQKARQLAEGQLYARAALYHRKGKYGLKNIKALLENQLWGVNLTADWHHDFSSLHDTLLIIEELARHCPQSAALALDANLGVSSAIHEFGTHKQKALLARFLSKGDKPALCLDEEGATPFDAIKLTAQRQGNSYILNGAKTSVIGGGISKFHLIVARLNEKGEDKGLAAFIMVRDPSQDIHPSGLGIEIEQNRNTISGIPAAKLTFDNVVIPSHQRLYFSDEAAFKNTLLESRFLGESIMALGFAYSALNEAKHITAQTNHQQRSYAEKTALEKAFIQHETSLHACRLMLYEAAETAGFINHRVDGKTSARARLFAFDYILKAMQFALNLASHNGFQHKEKIERLYEALQIIHLKGSARELLYNDVANTIIPFTTPKQPTMPDYASNVRFIEAAE